MMIRVRSALQIYRQLIKLDVAAESAGCSVSGRGDKDQGADKDVNGSLREDLSVTSNVIRHTANINISFNLIYVVV